MAGLRFLYFPQHYSQITRGSRGFPGFLGEAPATPGAEQPGQHVHSTGPTVPSSAQAQGQASAPFHLMSVWALAATESSTSVA